MTAEQIQESLSQISTLANNLIETESETLSDSEYFYETLCRIERHAAFAKRIIEGECVAMRDTERQDTKLKMELKT